MSFSSFCCNLFPVTCFNRPSSIIMTLQQPGVAACNGRWSRLLLAPFRVERAALINALIGVGTKEVALCLKQILGQVLGAVRIVVAQRSREGRHGDAETQGRAAHLTPAHVAAS